jgi:hypothetical protein
MGRNRLDNYVGYEEALNKAHEQGLNFIDTDFVQLPTKDNGGRTIIKAKVKGDKGEFNATGDSAPDDASVNQNVRPHWIRMAETRAKGRALRDYINQGKDPELTS